MIRRKWFGEVVATLVEADDEVVVSQKTRLQGKGGGLGDPLVGELSRTYVILTRKKLITLDKKHEPDLMVDRSDIESVWMLDERDMGGFPAITGIGVWGGGKAGPWQLHLYTAGKHDTTARRLIEELVEDADTVGGLGGDEMLLRRLPSAGAVWDPDDVALEISRVWKRDLPYEITDTEASGWAGVGMTVGEAEEQIERKAKHDRAVTLTALKRPDKKPSSWHNTNIVSVIKKHEKRQGRKTKSTEIEAELVPEALPWTTRPLTKQTASDLAARLKDYGAEAEIVEIGAMEAEQAVAKDWAVTLTALERPDKPSALANFGTVSAIEEHEKRQGREAKPGHGKLSLTHSALAREIEAELKTLPWTTQPLTKQDATDLALSLKDSGAEAEVVKKKAGAEAEVVEKKAKHGRAVTWTARAVTLTALKRPDKKPTAWANLETHRLIEEYEKEQDQLGIVSDEESEEDWESILSAGRRNGESTGAAIGRAKVERRNKIFAELETLPWTTQPLTRARATRLARQLKDSGAEAEIVDIGASATD